MDARSGRVAALRWLEPGNGREVSMVAILAVLVVLGISGAVAVLDGWVLTYLWAWFMVPLGLPPIGIAWAIGISLPIMLMTNHEKPKQGEKTDLTEAIADAVLRPLAALLFGYVAHRCMQP
jgi:hypothetical protein